MLNDSSVHSAIACTDDCINSFILSNCVYLGIVLLPAELEAARPSTVGEEELQLQLALAMSKEEHDEEERRRRGDDVKLQLAIEESKKESDDVCDPDLYINLLIMLVSMFGDNCRSEAR